MAKTAIILLSGGLDSATTLAHAMRQGFECQALTFGYGQRHSVEIDAARAVATALRVRHHRIIQIDAAALAGSALTGSQDVPKGRAPSEITRGIPVTYVPARNILFLSYALAWAETIGAADIFIGINAVDYSGYPDCRPDFVRAFEQAANLGTKSGVEGRRFTIHTPLIELSKAQIVRHAIDLGVDLSLTHSCYDPSPDGRACGQCDSCQLRRKGFAEAGIEDPLPYVA
jgi:7-cyano-7-deazaguanine synthase